METLAVPGIIPGINEGLAVGLRQLLQSAEILIVAVPLPGQDGMQSVVKIVAPLRVQPITANRRLTDQSRVVEIAFGDEIERPALALSTSSNCFGQFRQNMPRAKIVDGMHRIQPQGVAMASFQPIQRITNHVFTHAGAVWTIVIDGIAPRRTVVVGKVGAQSP